MSHQMLRQPLAPYRLIGTGPIGFSVMGIPPSSAPPLLAEKLSRWRNKPISRFELDQVGVAFGEFARSQEWAKLSDVAEKVGLFLTELITRFGERGEFAKGLYVIQPDSDDDAIGGYLFIGDLWHRGHTRKFLCPTEAYVPYSWALDVLMEFKRPKLAEPALDRQT